MLGIYRGPTHLPTEPCRYGRPLDGNPTLCYKVRMEANWATDHLQVIRTLMERSALYRRALAPIMLTCGVIGIAAATAGRSR